MSLLEKMFGRGKKGESPTPAQAINGLRETEEMLIKKQEYLEGKIEQEISTARKHGTKNKRLALQALKRKKRYERQLQQIDGTLSTLEMQREALEGANTNTAVLTTMNAAAKAMKAAHQHMDVDKVHDMMDDVAEQQELAREITEAISNPTAFQTDYDEDELEKELEELEQEALDQRLLEPTPAASLPSPPSAEPEMRGAVKQKARPRKEEVDDDLQELEAWAS